MTARDPALEPFAVLVGAWETESTHPQIDEIVRGTVSFEWLEGCRFLIQRSRNDHELFPDAIWIIGPPENGDGLVMEYFDSRGVRRTYGVSLEDGVLRWWRDAPGFDQRFSARLAPDTFEGLSELARTPGDWHDDLKVRYRRVGALAPHLFAGVRVRDFQQARPWYERLLGAPAFLPHATEAVWTLGDGRSVYIVEHPAGAGTSVVTVFLPDLDAFLAEIATRGLEPSERQTLTDGVRKAIFRDPDGNEVAFAGGAA